VTSLIDAPPPVLPATTTTVGAYAYPAVGWLLGNLLEAAAGGLKAAAAAGGQTPAAKWRLAVRFASIASDLLVKMPPGALIWATSVWRCRLTLSTHGQSAWN